MTRRDLHHSQPLDALGREAPEIESDDERLRRLTQEDAKRLTWERIDKHLTEHIKLTRELNATLRDVRDQGHVERSTLLVLKDIHQEIRASIDSRHEHTTLLTEIRDDIRGLVNLLTMALSNGHAPH